MIQKTYSIICDACGCLIDHYPEYTRAEAIATAKADKIIFKGKKHYCDEKCYRDRRPQNDP